MEVEAACPSVWKAGGRKQMSNAATTWGVGDYPSMATHLREAALAVVEAVEVAARDQVLDVATGTGNAALLAAERGAEVVAVDFEPVLLQLADTRARDMGLAVHWLEGDLEALPVADDSADVVVSVFGVMYAADHAAAARELGRVARPGARIALASWVPGSFMPGMGQVLSGYLPAPPASSGPPSRWGDSEVLPRLLENGGLRMVLSSQRRLALIFADAAAGAAFLIRTAGHVLSEQQRLTHTGRWEDLVDELVAYVQQRAEALDGGLCLSLDYLLTTATSDS